jgi:polar amino acid transport system substrate-binding protein
MKSTIVVLAAVVCSVMAVWLWGPAGGPAPARETSFERMMRTNIVRCGYYVFPPMTYRDPSTKALSGMAVDIMNAIADRAGLTIEWTEEVNFSNWTEGLKAGRFDVACTPNWPDIGPARAAGFSAPMFYAGLHPMVRAKDKDLVGATLDRFNQPDVRFLTQDGSGIDVITRANFPKATIKAMPPTVDGPTMLLELMSNKADAIVLDKNAEYMYNQSHPGAFQLRDDLPPVKVQSFALAFNHGEGDLKNFLDIAIDSLISDGTMARLVKQWEPMPGTFLLTAQAYRE